MIQLQSKRKFDRDTADLHPTREHGFGEQLPSASILYFRTNLSYDLSIKM